MIRLIILRHEADIPGIGNVLGDKLVVRVT